MIARHGSEWSGTKEVQRGLCVIGYIKTMLPCALHVSPAHPHGSPCIQPDGAPSALYTSVIACVWDCAVTNTGTLHRRTNITTQHCNLIRSCPLRIAVAYHIRNVEAMIVVCLMNWHELYYMDLTHVNHKQLQAISDSVSSSKVQSLCNAAHTYNTDNVIIEHWTYWTVFARLLWTCQSQVQLTLLVAHITIVFANQCRSSNWWQQACWNLTNFEWCFF